ncbi:MAG: hypothetical protein F6K40_12005 [Okeania sp. SIO3I5]|uniref:hypothetical protein n=1 Tax=Okeania sp. SIO3I5 TaxID=2607805 RepID=UPI0013BB7357|nr:hypothetical protein [Okeania sp. SIO3I5]NEQ36957.1 hypothetical protein [Okeania sp. SIO3I5]
MRNVIIDTEIKADNIKLLATIDYNKFSYISAVTDIYENRQLTQHQLGFIYLHRNQIEQENLIT